MSRTRSLAVRPFFLLLMALALLLGATAAPVVRAQDEADPPGRVGRVAVREGPVWWFDDAQQAWAEAQPNLPLTTGDRVATDPGGRAELRIGSTSVVVDEDSELVFDRLDDAQIRVRVMHGNVALLLRADELAPEIWLGSDEVWLQPLRAGRYRLGRDGAITEATSWRGELQLADSSRLVVDTGRRAQLWREGGQLRVRMLASVEDAFATRVLTAEQAAATAAATRYVSPETTGYEDLDRYGRWEQHPEYGPVWYPVGVAVDWVPYRDGRWVWVRPWGWTWVDAAPWGFAPFHYGRWMQWRARWVWVPGPYVARPVWAPALVTWIDGPSIGIGIRIGSATLSWMPLAPWEPLVLGYRASPHYHARIEPPQWRRYSPPPGWRRDTHAGHNDAHRGVTVIPSTSLRRPPPAAHARPRPAPTPGPHAMPRPERPWPQPPVLREHEPPRSGHVPQMPRIEREQPSRVQPPAAHEGGRPQFERRRPFPQAEEGREPRPREERHFDAPRSGRTPEAHPRNPRPVTRPGAQMPSPVHPLPQAQAPIAVPTPAPVAPLAPLAPAVAPAPAATPGPAPAPARTRAPVLPVKPPSANPTPPQVSPGARTREQPRPGFERPGGQGPGHRFERAPGQQTAPVGSRSIEQRPEQPPATRGNHPARPSAR